MTPKELEQHKALTAKLQNADSDLAAANKRLADSNKEVADATAGKEQMEKVYEAARKENIDFLSSIEIK